MSVLIRSAILVVAGLFGGAAHAQTIDPTDLAPREDDYLARNNSTEAAILIRATNPLQCSVVFAESSATVDLTRERAYEVGVRLNCNAPFRITGRAANGALRNIDAYAPGDPRTFLPYTVAWPAMVGNGGQPIAPQFTAPGENWARGVDYASGTSVVGQSGAMRVEWRQPGQLLAGTYSETFTVELEAID